jgi:hypothetical protein
MDKLKLILIPDKTPSHGVVFFSWPLFERDSLRMEVISRLVHELL